jgi:hypothetical protein
MPTFADYKAALGGRLSDEELVQLMQLHQRLGKLFIQCWREEKRRRADPTAGLAASIQSE